MKIYLKKDGQWTLMQGEELQSEMKLQGIIVGEGASVGAGARLETTMDAVVLGPLGSENRMLTFYRHPTGVRAATGCFDGTLDEFSKAVDKKHGESRLGREYVAALAYARAKFALGNGGEK